MALSWGLAGLEYWFVIRSLFPQAELIWAYFMLPVTLLGVAVPSSPGFIGIFEAAGVFALSVFGVPKDRALAAALVLHGIVFVIGSGLGALALVGDGETLTGLYREAQGWLAAKSPRQVG